MSYLVFNHNIKTQTINQNIYHILIIKSIMNFNFTDIKFLYIITIFSTFTFFFKDFFSGHYFSKDIYL